MLRFQFVFFLLQFGPSSFWGLLWVIKGFQVHVNNREKESRVSGIFLKFKSNVWSGLAYKMYRQYS